MGPGLSNRANDVQAAMHVLARRPWHPGKPPLLLTRTDLRGIFLSEGRLDNVILRHADLRGANLTGACLEGADLTDVQTDDSTIWPAESRSSQMTAEDTHPVGED